MKRLLALIVVALGVAVSILLVARPDGAVAEAEGGLAEEESPAGELTAPEAALTLPEGEGPDARELAPVSSQARGASQPSASGPTSTIVGRVLLPGGEPAADVQLRVRGWTGNQDRKLRFGVPDDWEDPTGTTEADGTFALVFDPPRAFQFVLDASLEGHAEVRWRWHEILPGSTVDVGDVTLQRGGAIEGWIVDTDGAPVSGEGWRVYADGPRMGAGGRDATRGTAAADSRSGHFRIEDMSPGPVELKAHHNMANWIDGPTVTVVSGDTIETEIVYAGARFDQRITVTTFCRPFHVKSHPDASIIRLHGGPGGPVSARKIPGSSQSYAFDGLAPGSYAVEVDHPDYAPWRKENVRTGENVRAFLEGSAAIRLHVEDARGDSVELYSLRVRFEGVGFRPNEFEVHAGGEPLPGGLFEGMFPGTYTLTVRGQGGALCEAPLEDLAPGETRDVSIRLGRPTRVEGRITRGGEPVPGVDVVLARTAEVEDSSASPLLRAGTMTSDERSYRVEVASAWTDSGGGFSLEAGAPGQHVVVALAGGGMRRSSDVFSLAAGTTERIDLDLPAAGRLVGRVLAPGQSLEGMRVWVRPESLVGRGGLSLHTGVSVLELRDDGVFDTGPIAPGPAAVFLLPPAIYQGGFSTAGPRGRPSGGVELGVAELAGGTVTEQDFELSVAPGRVSVVVLNHGTPLAGAGVTLVSETGGRMDAVTDGQGRTGPMPVFPGTWTVRVSHGSRGWTHVEPGPLTIVAGGEREFHIDPQATQGILTLVDSGTGDPLAGREVGLRSEWEAATPFFHRRETTDGEGRLTLTLTPGTYELELDPWNPFESLGGTVEPPENPRRASVEWSAGGPGPEPVKL